MSYQVIKQPDGRLCIWCTVSDELEVFDAEEDEVIEFFIEMAQEDAAEKASRTVAAVLNNTAHGPYGIFTITYDEVAEDHKAAQLEVYGEIRN